LFSRHVFEKTTPRLHDDYTTTKKQGVQDRYMATLLPASNGIYNIVQASAKSQANDGNVTLKIHKGLLYTVESYTPYISSNITQNLVFKDN
jgi:hypothetical protein